MLILDQLIILAYSSVSITLQMLSHFIILFIPSGSTQEILKDHLMEELDYDLLPKQAWDFLVSRYGLSQGSQPIPRLFDLIFSFFWLI